MVKISQLPSNTAPTTPDYLPLVDFEGNVTGRLSLTDLITFLGSGTLPNKYQFSAYRNGAWTAANATFVKVAFDTELYDTNSNFDPVTNNRYVAPVSGFYHFDYVLSFTLGSGQIGIATLYKNGSEIRIGSQIINGAGVVGVSLVGSGNIQVTAGDYFEVYNYGDNRAGQQGSNKTSFSGFLISKT